MDYIGLGKRIRRQRQAQHLTQEKLAELAGISLSFLGHIERGTRTASLETVVRLANVMRVSVDYLLADSLNIDGGAAVRQPSNVKHRQVLNELSRLIQDNLDAWVE